MPLRISLSISRFDGDVWGRQGCMVYVVTGCLCGFGKRGAQGSHTTAIHAAVRRPATPEGVVLVSGSGWGGVACTRDGVGPGSWRTQGRKDDGGSSLHRRGAADVPCMWPVWLLGRQRSCARETRIGMTVWIILFLEEGPGLDASSRSRECAVYSVTFTAKRGSGYQADAGCVPDPSVLVLFVSPNSSQDT